MYSKSNKKLNFLEIEKYRLPIYNRKSKDKIVYFYVLDPQSVLDGAPKMKRIRKKFAHIHSAKERDDAALRFRDEIARKLKEGWNPLVEECGNKSFALFDDVLDKFKRHMTKLKKDDVYTEKTYYDYCNRLERLRKYNEQCKHRITYIYQFDTPYIESYLEWIYVDCDNGPRTRNNYLVWIGTFCTFCRANGYIHTHPTEDIKPLREKDKQRKPLSRSDMKRLLLYLQDNNKPYLLACMFQYYLFVRPKELVCLRVGDVSVKDQTLFVSHNISKNRKDGVVTIPAKVIRLMIELNVLSAPSDYYLFGRDFLPSPEKSHNGIFRNKWLSIRKELNFPFDYKFYSLKDTGITDTIDGAGLTVAKDQARHSSVHVTNAYCRKEQHSVHPELKNFDGAL